MTVPFSTAKSLLFVPGDRAERIPKALASDAHAVIVDLEDAVSAENKLLARQQVSDFLATSPDARILLRVNPVDTEGHDADLALAEAPGVAGIILPKATTRATSDVVQKAQTTPLWPLVETAEGLRDLAGMSTMAEVPRMLLGTIDLALDLGLDVDQPGGLAMMDMARFHLLTVSTAAGLAPPVDGVFTGLDDPGGLADTARHARACGFGGMMCIHPRQAATVNAAFAASTAQIDWARRVLKAADGQPGAFQFEGQMIDAPVLERAKRLLAS